MSWDFLVKTAAILGYFLQLHSGCVAAAAGGPWDVITSVPSSTGREGEHPLVQAIKLLPDIRDQYETLLERGEVNITHTRLAPSSRPGRSGPSIGQPMTAASSATLR
jgi:hypothetical protein